MRAKQKTLVVFYNARKGMPLRTANLVHLCCWGRYSKHRVVYVNAAYSVPWFLLDRVKIDTIIFDTIFLSMHWSPPYFKERSAQVARVGSLECTKIAVAQDEFINTDYVVEFLNEVRITDLLTITTPADWAAVYGKLDWRRVRFRSVLTGYVDEAMCERQARKPSVSRSIDIGYRAWANPFWLGEQGRKKVLVGDVFREPAKARGFKVDINNPASKDFLIGDDWFSFLRKCRCVLGVEGGASVLDRDGSIRNRVEQYVADHPSASFEEVRDACFLKEEGSLKELAALSPRHFEAAMTRTCQVLVEGSYSGVMEAWRHYIPVKADFSNIDEVLDAVADDSRVQAIAGQAFSDLIESERWSYRSFVSEIEEGIIDVGEAKLSTWRTVPIVLILRVWDKGCWSFALFESSRVGARVLMVVSIVSRSLRSPRRAFKSAWRLGLKTLRARRNF